MRIEEETTLYVRPEIKILRLGRSFVQVKVSFLRTFS